MGTTNFAADLTLALMGIYRAIHNSSGLGARDAERAQALVGERVDLFYDIHEMEEFIARTRVLVAEGAAPDVAALRAASEIVDDGLLAIARHRGGGWDALYGPETDPTIDPDRPDYRWTTAEMIAEGDGLYDPTNGSIVASCVTRVGDLIGVTYIDRGSMVHEAMGNLPDGVAETVGSMVLHATDRVRVRR
jgi:hypothetical protein